MVPEVASNVELQSNETFDVCADTLKVANGGDFLSATANSYIEEGRHSQKL